MEKFGICQGDSLHCMNHNLNRMGQFAFYHMGQE